VVDDQGVPLKPESLYLAGRRLYYFRTLESEPHIPFEAHVLWRNEHLLVVDKPHFLPVLPSGKYLQETVLVRLKRQLGMRHLSPIHRIDRDTAGVVLFSVQPASRGAYHELFRKRQVDKTYECIAPWNPDLLWPMRRETRIGPAAHFMQQAELPGTPNALTHIETLEVRSNLARYLLRPVTGQRHQLRVHMAALGLPILGDGIYPHLTPEGCVDYTKPLQLLARSIAFIDPICNEQRIFHSQRHLLSLDTLENACER
jgi:tRNA pseudouridine32 synthase/23S rRNA pseudouridine746 synthase